MLQVTLRRAGAEDVEHVKWALYTALVWKPGPRAAADRRHARARRGGPLSPRLRAARGSRNRRSRGRWRRRSRVREDYRGRGLGGWLLNELAQAAEAEGFTRLSLSVAADNPARRLYERLGYDEVSADESGLRMAL